MQLHELACSSLSLHAVPFFVWAAHKNFAVLVLKASLSKSEPQGYIVMQGTFCLCACLSEAYAVKWACMQLHKLACSHISLHAVTEACIQLHKLAFSYISLHAVTWAYLELACSSIIFNTFCLSSSQDLCNACSIMYSSSCTGSPGRIKVYKKPNLQFIKIKVP